MEKLQKYLFYLILIVFPFGQLFRLDLTKFLPGLRLHLIDFVVFAFVIAWFLKKVVKKKSFNLPFFSKEMLVFGAIASLSLFFQIGRLRSEELLGASFYLMRFLNFIAFFFALVDLLQKEKLSIFDYLLGEGLVIAFFSLFQYLVLPDTRFLFNFGWDEHYFRAIGPFLDPAFTGLLVALAFIVWLVNFNEIKTRRIWYWLIGLVLLVSVGLSFSRISYLSLFVGICIVLGFKKHSKYLLFFILIFYLIVLLLPKPGGEGVNLLRKFSILARVDTYRQSLSIIKNHWLFGVGFNSYRYAQKDYGFLSLSDWQKTNAGAGSDNSFLFVFATTGIFGLIIFLFFWLRLIYFSFVFSQRKKSSLLLFASLVCLTVSSLAVNSLFYAWLMVWLMILLANFTVDNKLSTPVQSCSEQGQEKQS